MTKPILPKHTNMKFAGLRVPDVEVPITIGGKMREIRFRAWDKKLKEMIDFNDNGIDTYLLSICSEGWQIEFDNSENDKRYFGKERFILMQFTGLLDRNNVEIFEGDVVKTYELGRLKIGLLVIKNGLDFDDWNNPTGYIAESIELVPDRLYPRKLVTTRDSLNKAYAKQYEVIGNKYSNPELLK